MPLVSGGQQVVEREPELLGELARGGVVLVDQLAAVLGELSVGEGSGASSSARRGVGGLVELGGEAGSA